MPDLKYTKDLYGPLKVKNLQVQKIKLKKDYNFE